MNKLFFAIAFIFSAFLYADFSKANHCSGGHKEIKETKETDSEDSKEAKSN